MRGSSTFWFIRADGQGSPVRVGFTGVRPIIDFAFSGEHAFTGVHTDSLRFYPMSTILAGAGCSIPRHPSIAVIQILKQY